MRSDSHLASSYLSILGWPAGFLLDDRIEALVASIGMDPDQARSEAMMEPPTVVGTVDAIISDEILRVLHNLGVLAVAPSEDELAMYPDPEPIKRIARFPETSPTAFAADDNDEPAWTFTTDDIRLIVSGTARYTETKVSAKRTTMGAGNGTSRYSTEVETVRTERIRTKDMLDIHLVMNGKPRLLRLTGQRTLIRSLEDIDDPPSLLNPLDPIGLLKPHIPGVQIDQAFDSFNPPPKIRLKSGGSRHSAKKRTPEAFGFYSVWLATINRMLRGEG